MMPKMDGVETTKKIRETGYTEPIFALTANALVGQQEVFLSNGFSGFISKPIDMRQLNDSLNKFIRDKEYMRRREAGLPDYTAINAPELGEKETRTEPRVINIPGLNAKTGLALYNGNFDIYLSVLRSFVPNALMLINSLSSVSEETLHDYAINMHGLKGISAGIGAEKVSETAFELEMIAKSGKISEILSGNGELLDETKNLVFGIQEWLKECNSNDSKPLLPNPDRTLLARLRVSCEAYDMNGIDNIMDELENANYTNNASLVVWLREKINESDFSAVTEKLLEYKEESV
jgi:CheY-like chemotaxis protein